MTQQDDLGLGDVLDSLLTRLDLSWLGPDPEDTTDMLEVVLIFVQSMKEERVEAPTEQNVVVNDGDEGEITRFVKGTPQIHLEYYHYETCTLYCFLCALFQTLRPLTMPWRMIAWKMR